MSGSAWPSQRVGCHGAVWKMLSGAGAVCLFFVAERLKVFRSGTRVVGFRVSGLGLRVSGLGLRVSGLGLRAWGLGLRASGLGLKA